MRDFGHLPRVEVIWDFPGGGYCCPECGVPFTVLGDHVIEQLDWQVTVRVVAHCRRRYRRACRCRIPATVMAPGPPKAIGKGLLSNRFLAMLLTERYVAGRSQNSLVTGLARHGAQVWAATLAGACAQAGAVLARHAGIDEATGQLAGDGDAPRQLVISSDFYSVYTSAGRKADGLVNLFCWAHIRRYFVRAGDAAGPAQLTYWTQAWLERAPGHSRPRPADNGTVTLATTSPLQTGHVGCRRARTQDFRILTGNEPGGSRCTIQAHSWDSP